jgi:hypothetical protein
MGVAALVTRIALALALVVGASAAWADEMCPRKAQQAAYLAMIKSTATEEPAAAITTEPAATVTADAAETAEAAN